MYECEIQEYQPDFIFLLSLQLINDYENDQLTPTELAISLGQTVKIKKG